MYGKSQIKIYIKGDVVWINGYIPREGVFKWMDLYSIPREEEANEWIYPKGGGGGWMNISWKMS